MVDKKKLTVLLVDDDDFLLDIYSSKFKTKGFEVETACGAEEALVKIKEGFFPEALLLDMLMPKIDGFEFLEQLKKEKILDKFLIIVLSNKQQKDDIERSKKFGVAEYIIKANFTPSEVVEKVKLLLTNHNNK